MDLDRSQRCLKLAERWFWVGMVAFVASLACFVAAFLSDNLWWMIPGYMMIAAQYGCMKWRQGPLLKEARRWLD